MTKYHLWIEFRDTVKLSEIERTAPKRHLVFSSLGQAISCANITLMALGYGMHYGPRRISPYCSYCFTRDNIHENVTIIIQREG